MILVAYLFVAWVGAITLLLLFIWTVEDERQQQAKKADRYVHEAWENWKSLRG